MCFRQRKFYQHRLQLAIKFESHSWKSRIRLISIVIACKIQLVLLKATNYVNIVCNRQWTTNSLNIGALVFYSYYENSNLCSLELCWHRSRSAVNSESCSQKCRITMISIAIGRKVQLRGWSSRFNFVYTGAVSCRAHRCNKYKVASDPTWLTMRWLWLIESLKGT